MYGAWCPKEGRTSWQPYSDNKGVMQFKKVGTSSVKEMDRQRQLEFWNLVKQTDAEFPPEEDDERLACRGLHGFTTLWCT